MLRLLFGFAVVLSIFVLSPTRDSHPGAPHLDDATPVVGGMAALAPVIGGSAAAASALAAMPDPVRRAALAELATALPVPPRRP